MAYSTDRSKAVVPVLVLVLLFVSLWFILRGDFFCLTLCYFVLVLFSPFSIATTSLGVKRANLSVFRSFVRFVLIWLCRFPLPLGVWEGLRFLIVALPGLSSYLYFSLPKTESFQIKILIFFSNFLLEIWTVGTGEEGVSII